MVLSFYLFGLLCILTTIRLITHTNPVHVLLYLIMLLLSLAGVFFSLGAYFAGALEIIIYAGAIMVLFVFVVMMLNRSCIKYQEREWLKPKLWIGPGCIAILQLIIMIYASTSIMYNKNIHGMIIDAKSVSISLFHAYALVIEMISMLLLAGLVVVFHLGHDNHPELPSNNMNTIKNSNKNS